MNRRMYGADRAVLTALAVILLLVGAWLLAWVLDLLPSGWWNPERISAGVPESVSEAEWWPWALLLGGLLLAALGAAWFANHFRSNKVSTLSLRGDAEGGRLLLDSGALADGAAQALVASCEGVVGAKGKIVESRRQIVLDMTASIHPDADLRDVSRACDVVAAQVLRGTGRDDMACRVRLTVAHHPAKKARVH